MKQQIKSYENHGCTPAAWTFTIISLIGATVSAVALCIPNSKVFYTGISIIIFSCGISFLMKKLGYGKNK